MSNTPFSTGGLGLPGITVYMGMSSFVMKTRLRWVYCLYFVETINVQRKIASPDASLMMGDVHSRGFVYVWIEKFNQPSVRPRMGIGG
jgi:hypothetical protein